MLNISDNSVSEDVLRQKWSGLDRVERFHSGRLLVRLLSLLSVIFIISLFLPWTQHIRTKGNVTTLLPQQRPQGINTIIPGRIEEWYIREGDQVAKGDTILFLSEIKNEYFDPQILARTRQQIEAKSASAEAYKDKAQALGSQKLALVRSRDAKLEQAKNKIEQTRLKVLSDSINLVAKELNYDIAKEQYDRQLGLYNKGLKSLTDLEKRQMTLQKADAEKIGARNKLGASRASVLTAVAELESVNAKYSEDLAKTQSERFSALSNGYSASGEINKLENQYSNYEVRSRNYYITAPQDGFITRTVKAGIGEIVKEGEEVATIMPKDYQLAVEMYVEPIDLPLLEIGQVVRLQFDGWPAIIFSGWPNTSYGTFGGQVFAIDNFISDNGYYRVLVAQSEEEPWPDLLRVGGGSNGLVLLKDVRIWYEIWRNLNGFPADFYKKDDSVKLSQKKK